MTPAVFKKVDSELARFVVAAGPFAERLLIESGATPDPQDDFNNTMDAFVRVAHKQSVRRSDLDADTKLVKEFFARFTFAEVDGVRSAQTAIAAERAEAAYALGVAVGLRLAGVR